MQRPNFVIIMTDTQTLRMVGAYGLAAAQTPHLDQLARSGLRCDTAYTACPLCTPARGALFTGLYPASNGAWANNIAPASDVANMGQIMRAEGYRTAYTGKWHLDGGAYFGDGEPAEGFEPDWWYDGYSYAKEIGREAFHAYKQAKNIQELAAQGLDREENLWGYRVANRAIDFLETVQDDESFCLVVSFDEPHGPHRRPTESWEKNIINSVPASPAFGHVAEREPALHAQHRADLQIDGDWETRRQAYQQIWDCNHWIDSQIGRALAAVHARAKDDTVIIYTSDHGEQQFDHGLKSKGPMMYEPSVHIPFLVRMPEDAGGRTTQAPMSHLDILPTMLDLAGGTVPPVLQGVSQAAVWRGETSHVRDAVFGGFHRFAVNHDSWGAWYPVRYIVADQWKLIINLDDDDQRFDLQNDPHELVNRIGDASSAERRNALHDAILAEMDRTRDPFRTWRWANRPWRGQIQTPWYFGGERRNKPAGFDWQPQPLEHD
jgi:uncharacterized sulfatase